MILKCKQTIEREALSNDRLYPVLAYETEGKTDICRFLIADDCGSLAWHDNNHLDIISNNLDCYIKESSHETTITYIHIDLADRDFLTKYYLENEESVIARSNLENTIVSILSNELTADDLEKNLDVIGYNDENTDVVLRAFFKNADISRITKFSEELYCRIVDIKSHILKIIVDELSRYRAKEIDNLFIEIHASPYCTDEILDKINQYLKV